MEKLQAVYGNIDEAQANMHKKLLETASEAKNTTLQYEAMADAAARVVNAKNNGQTNYKGKDLLDNNLWDKVNDSAAHFEMLADNIQEASDLLKQDGSPAAEDFSEKLKCISIMKKNNSILFIIVILTTIFFWLYVALFCCLYNKTQKYMIYGSVITFIINIMLSIFAALIMLFVF